MHRAHLLNDEAMLNSSQQDAGLGEHLGQVRDLERKVVLQLVTPSVLFWTSQQEAESVQAGKLTWICVLIRY